MRSSALILLLICYLPAVATDVDRGNETEASHPISMHKCEAWQDHVRQLQASDDAFERSLGEFHARPDFVYCSEQMVRTSRFDVDWSPDWELDLPDLQGLALVLRWLAILLLCGLVVRLVLRLRNLPMPKGSSSKRAEQPRRPQFMAEAFDEPLPDDIPAAAREAWRSGKPRLALSLLYRGALEKLAAGEDIGHGATEGEVITRLQQHRTDDSIVAYMRRLINGWLSTAWAQRPPGDATFDALDREWVSLFVERDGERP